MANVAPPSGGSASLWFAVAYGRGSSLRGEVYGPYSSVAAFQAAYPPNTHPGSTWTVIGDKNGYPSQAAAEAEVTSFDAASEPSKLQQAGTTTSPDLPNPLSGLAAIGDFFGRLESASTWVRVAEVVLGLGLIVVGLAHIAEGTPVGKAAATAAKAAALL